MTIAVLNNNYTVGRGEVYFDDDSVAGAGEAFFGDTKSFNLTVKSTTLDHYQSTGGVRQVDASATIQTDASGTMVTENVNQMNLALFFFGTPQTVTTTAGVVTSEVVGPVIVGNYYQLGTSVSDPAGVKGLDSGTPAVFKNSAGSVTYVLGTDYTIDYILGRIQILAGGAIASGDLPKITYHTQNASKSRVISGTNPIEGAIRFLSNNVSGSNRDWFIPRARITPNGTFDLISDAFAMLSFDVHVLRSGNLPLLYIDGRAV